MAYSVLSDPEKKRVYDEYGEEGIKGGVSAEEYESFNPFDLFGSFFGDDMSDMFGFSGFSERPSGYGKKNRKSYRPEPVEIELDCELAELYKGGEKSVRIPHQIICKECRGIGSKEAPVKCKKCKGSGQVCIRERMGPVLRQSLSVCSACNGSGTFIPPKNRCKACGGKGVIRESKSYSVTIPKGASSGQTIVLKGAGNEEKGTRAGDVILVIMEKTNTLFKRSGNHLLYKMELSLSEALCGFSKVITLLDDRKILISVPRGTVTKPSYKVVKGEGMPSLDGNGESGDLIIHFSVSFPESLSIEEAGSIASILQSHYPIEETRIGDEVVEEVKLEPVDATNYRPRKVNEDHSSIHVSVLGVYYD